MGDFREERPELVLPAALRGIADVQHVEQAASGITNRADDLLETAPAVIFEDDAGVWSEIDTQVGIYPLGIGNGRSNAVVDETPSQGAAFDQELDLEHARQNPVKGSDNQLVLTDG